MNDNGQDTIDSATKLVCSASLRRLLRNSDGVVFAVVATVDGFPIASQSAPGWDVSSDRLAAMASSIHALGNSISGDLIHANCENVMIDADRISVVFLAIPELDNPPLILGVAAKKTSSLGTVLYEAGATARRISRPPRTHEGAS